MFIVCFGGSCVCVCEHGCKALIEGERARTPRIGCVLDEYQDHHHTVFLLHKACTDDSQNCLDLSVRCTRTSLSFEKLHLDNVMHDRKCNDIFTFDLNNWISPSLNSAQTHTHTHSYFYFIYVYFHSALRLSFEIVVSFSSFKRYLFYFLVAFCAVLCVWRFSLSFSLLFALSLRHRFTYTLISFFCDPFSLLLAGLL